MKIVKVVFVVLAVLAMIAGALWHFWARDTVAFANIGTSFAAKQVCSCVFVAERTLDSCKGDSLTDISQLSFKQSEDSVTASAAGGLISNTAQYQSGLGCTLIID